MSNRSGVHAQPAYFSRFAHLRMNRDADGILLVEMHANGGPILGPIRRLPKYWKPKALAGA